MTQHGPDRKQNAQIKIYKSCYPHQTTDFHRCGNLWVAMGVVLAKGHPQISTDLVAVGVVLARGHPQISTDFHRCGNLWVAVGVVLAKGHPQISTHFHRCGNMWFYVGGCGYRIFK